jgi:hypothetical protein
MKIDPTSQRPTTSVRKTGGSSASGPGGFAKALSDAQPSHSPGMPVSVGFTDLNTVLALQEAPDASRGRARKRAKERADMMLDQLDEIRLGLLLGTIPVSKLEQLGQLVRTKREQIDDPKLLGDPRRDRAPCRRGVGEAEPPRALTSDQEYLDYNELTALAETTSGLRG